MTTDQPAQPPPARPGAVSGRWARAWVALPGIGLLLAGIVAGGLVGTLAVGAGIGVLATAAVAVGMARDVAEAARETDV